MNNIKEGTQAIGSAIKSGTEAIVDKAGFSLIDGWHKFYKMYSIWFYTILGLAPDIYNQAVSSGVIDSTDAPQLLVRIINGIAFAGAVSRLIKQKTLEEKAAQDSGQTPPSP